MSGAQTEAPAGGGARRVIEPAGEGRRDEARSYLLDRLGVPACA